MIRVFICDDAPEYRALLRAVFGDEADIDVIGEASDGAQCIERVPALDTDVVLLDINRPELTPLSRSPTT